MSEWRAEGKNLKRYPHFDAPISSDKLETLVRDPSAVAHHKFYPFLLYEEVYQPFRPLLKDPKKRKIRYASRQDAAVFSYYRYLLSARYEALLATLDISDCVVAYRKLVSAKTGKGKCNIHFAKDAFDKILELGNCVAVAVDIKSYFERIDHKRLYSVWCRILDVEKLPADHLRLFKNITNYAEVDRRAVYERLGFFGLKTVNGRTRPGYLTHYDDIPTQLCSPQEFREKIVGGSGSYPKLIAKNLEAFGIPQGAPLSDLLANAYLMDFDVEMKAYAAARNGFYRRYSDDILLIMPGDSKDGLQASDHISKRIPDYGSQLTISSHKTCIAEFSTSTAGVTFRPITAVGRNGFEYLGFRFDGRKVYLRDNTLTNFDRRMALASRSAATEHAKRYADKDLGELFKLFHFESFEKEFGKIEDFGPDTDIKDWTFWTYARRAVDVFGLRSTPIYHQLKGHKARLRQRVSREINRAYWNLH